MKLFIWCIIITLWIINYRIWISYNEKINKKTILLIIAIIIQITTMSIAIWIFNPLYYKEHSFIYIFLDEISYAFVLLVLAGLITCIICAIYKGIGHRYVEIIEQTSNYDTLKFRTDIENADKEIEKFFNNHIFYFITIIVHLWQIPEFFS